MLYAAFVASLTAVLANSDAASKAYREKMDTLNQCVLLNSFIRLAYVFFMARSIVSHAAHTMRRLANRCRRYMKNSELPHELREKLRMYYRLCFPDRRAFDQEKIMSEVSPQPRSAPRSEVRSEAGSEVRSEVEA